MAQIIIRLNVKEDEVIDSREIKIDIEDLTNYIIENHLSEREEHASHEYLRVEE